MDHSPSSPPPPPSGPPPTPNPTPGWIGGAVLIVIGAVFLMRNLSGFELNNWWALFILIPAFGSLARAYSAVRAEGRVSAQARGAMIGGLVLTMIAAAFLFNLDFGQIWPLFLIIGGIGLLLGAIFDRGL